MLALVNKKKYLALILLIIVIFSRKFECSEEQRFLTYKKATIIKLVIGYSEPVETKNLNSLYQLNMVLNFQMQYASLPDATHYFDYFFNENRGRMDIYSIIEHTLSSLSLNGRDCLLLTICEAAYEPIHGNSFYHKIIRFLLTPPQTDGLNIYVEAFKAGKFGIDCSTCYPKCNIKSSWLGKNSVYQ